MANEGRQVVFLTLRSIARASGRVSMVMMILLMLVYSECDLVIFDFVQLYRKRGRNATQKIEFVLVHGDGVQGARQKIFQFDDFRLLRLHGNLMLCESVKRLHDVFVL